MYPRKNIYRAERLEATKEECQQWQTIYGRIRERMKQYQDQKIPKEYAQSMAFLNDPDMGPILAMITKKNIELDQSRPLEDIKDIDDGMGSVAKQKERLNINASIVNQIAEKILDGQPIEENDFDGNKYLQLKVASEAQRKYLGSIGSIIWHKFVQNNEYDWLSNFEYNQPPKYFPYILSLARDEAKQVINLVFQEAWRLKWEVHTGLESRLAQDESLEKIKIQ